MKQSIGATLLAFAFCAGACTGTSGTYPRPSSTGGSSASKSGSGGSTSAKGSSSVAGGSKATSEASGGGGNSGSSENGGSADSSGTDSGNGGGGIISNGGASGGTADSAAGGQSSASNGSGGTPGSSASSSGPSTVVDAGMANGSVPCDIQTLFATRCISCHGSTPSGGAPRSLVSFLDLTRADPSNPSLTEAQVALQRMQDTAAPMPPAPAAAVPASQITALQNWINAGYPSGSCGGDAGPPPGPDPLNAAPTCTRNSTWNGGNQESPSMNPGQACIACHSRGEGPRFTIAGTLYATGHEPNNCYGVNGGGGGLKVVVTDSAGASVSLIPNSAGNFYSSANLKMPFKAKVVNGAGVERVMATALSTGDCNSCHTQSGANGAPGRITIPM